MLGTTLYWWLNDVDIFRMTELLNKFCRVFVRFQCEKNQWPNSQRCPYYKPSPSFVTNIDLAYLYFENFNFLVFSHSLASFAFDPFSKSSMHDDGFRCKVGFFSWSLQVGGWQFEFCTWIICVRIIIYSARRSFNWFQKLLLNNSNELQVLKAIEKIYLPVDE